MAEVTGKLSGRTRGLLLLVAMGIGIGVGYGVGNPLEGGVLGLLAGLIIFTRSARRTSG